MRISMCRDFAHVEFFGRCVALLDDPLDLAVTTAHDAPVPGGVVHDGGEECGGVAVGDMGGDEFIERVWLGVVGCRRGRMRMVDSSS